MFHSKSSSSSSVSGSSVVNSSEEAHDEYSPWITSIPESCQDTWLDPLLVRDNAGDSGSAGSSSIVIVVDFCSSGFRESWKVSITSDLRSITIDDGSISASDSESG